MSSTPIILIDAQDIPASVPATPPYTADAAGKGTYVDKVTLCNHSGAAATVTVSLVSLGDTPQPYNTFTYTIAAGTTELAPEIAGKYIGPGYFITWASTPGSVVAGAMNGRGLA